MAIEGFRVSINNQQPHDVSTTGIRRIIGKNHAQNQTEVFKQTQMVIEGF
jgi:hypothetical protein